MLLARRVWNGGATKESKPRKNTSVRFQFILETASVFLLLCIIPSFQSVWFLFSVLPRRRAEWIVHTESESDKQKKAFHFHSVSWAGFVCVGVWMGVGVPKKKSSSLDPPMNPRLRGAFCPSFFHWGITAWRRWVLESTVDWECNRIGKRIEKSRKCWENKMKVVGTFES